MPTKAIVWGTSPAQHTVYCHYATEIPSERYRRLPFTKRQIWKSYVVLWNESTKENKYLIHLTNKVGWTVLGGFTCNRMNPWPSRYLPDGPAGGCRVLNGKRIVWMALLQTFYDRSMCFRVSGIEPSDPSTSPTKCSWSHRNSPTCCHTVRN